jgi:RNA-directed DNA polymerase
MKVIEAPRLKVGSTHTDSTTPDKAWECTFSENNIRRCFMQHIYPKNSQGVDRISVDLFKRDLQLHVSIIAQKCKEGTYKFSPYLEVLQSKGRDKHPRLISIPTVRDRLVLKLLTEYLHLSFEEYIARDLPNTVVRKITKEITGNGADCYIKLDIKNFFGSISHKNLLQKVEAKNTHKPFLKLLKKAIENPTLSANYSAKQRKEAKKNTVGVPQGLSISNILAEIYVQELDVGIRPISKAYFRFVDDVFILCDKNSIQSIWSKINTLTSQIGIELSKEKCTGQGAAEPVGDGFEFLGYKFIKDIISARESSYRRFLDSIIGKVTKFKYDFEKAPADKKDQKKTAFIENINEKITGAIDKKRRYGWIFFFSEINNLQMLSEIDRVVERLLRGVQGISDNDLKQVKKISRAYYEVNYSPQRGYIHNYNTYDTVEKKIKYLIRIGSLNDDPNASYKQEDIEEWFEQAKNRNLLKLEQDVTTFS